MKRRDFVKNTAFTAIGASLIAPLGSFAKSTVTHLESDELSPSAAIPGDFPLNLWPLAIGDVTGNLTSWK